MPFPSFCGRITRTMPSTWRSSIITSKNPPSSRSEGRSSQLDESACCDQWNTLFFRFQVLSQCDLTFLSNFHCSVGPMCISRDLALALKSTDDIQPIWWSDFALDRNFLRNRGVPADGFPIVPIEYLDPTGSHGALMSADIPKATLSMLLVGNGTDTRMQDNDLTVGTR